MGRGEAENPIEAGGFAGLRRPVPTHPAGVPGLHGGKTRQEGLLAPHAREHGLTGNPGVGKGGPDMSLQREGERKTTTGSVSSWPAPREDRGALAELLHLGALTPQGRLPGGSIASQTGPGRQKEACRPFLVKDSKNFKAPFPNRNFLIKKEKRESKHLQM